LSALTSAEQCTLRDLLAKLRPASDEVAEWAAETRK
jgi:hypothetical protein